MCCYFLNISESFFLGNFTRIFYYYVIVLSTSYSRINNIETNKKTKKTKQNFTDVKLNRVKLKIEYRHGFFYFSSYNK